MSRIYDSIVDLTYNTPLVKLNRLVPPHCGTVLVKLEYMNPLGSVKDRVGRAMIEAAEKAGILTPQSHIIEPTSGNMGISLAFVAAARRYRLTLTMPESMSYERRALLRMLGANVVLTPAKGGMPAAIAKAHELAKTTDILEDLVRDHPGVADYRYDLSETYAMSPERLDKALAISEQLVAEHPNIPDYAVSSVNIRLRQNPHLRESDPAAAETNLRKALDVQAALARRFPENTSYIFWRAVIQESLGGLLQERGRLTEARSALEDCTVSFEALLQKDPKAGHIRGILAKNYASLSDVLRRLGDEQAAEEAANKARELRKTN